MTPHVDSDTAPTWEAGPASLARGVVAFLVFTAAGFAVLLVITGGWGFGWEDGQARPLFLVLALLAAGADLFLGAARYQIFIRELLPGASVWLSLRADLANRFVGAMTPSQTGGLPAQLWVLHRGGLPVSDSLAFLVINFLATLVFFLIAGTLTTLGLRGQFSQEAVGFLFQYGFVAFAAVLVFIVVAILRPDLVTSSLERPVARLEASRFRWLRAVAVPGRIVVRSGDRYGRTNSRLIRERPHLLAASLLLTGVLYLNKFTIAWLLMRAMGVEASYGLTLGIQAILHFVLYFAPTPGASGLGEISTGALMAVLMPTHLLAVFTVAFRLLTLYLPAAVGSVVIFGMLRAGAVRRPATAEISVAGCLLLLLLPLTATAQVASESDSVGREDACAVAGGGNGAAPARSGEAVLVEPVWERVRAGMAASGDEAEEAFARAVSLGRERVACLPGSADVHYVLAVALGLHMELQGIRTKVRMAGEVRDEAGAALELDPDHAGAHHVLGRLYAGIMRMGRVETFVVRRILGGGWMEEASWERAEEHFRRASEGEPDNPFHAMELGTLYMDTGREELAWEELARAISLPERTPEDGVAIARARNRLAMLECGAGCPP